MSLPLTISGIKVGLTFLRRVVIPVWTADSGKPGPVLLVTAAQHGNEVHGSAAIAQFMTQRGEALSAGSIIGVPFCNLPAVRQHRPHLGMRAGQAYEDDRGRNMNRLWPGAKRGSVPARIAFALYQHFATRVTHVLDLHAWQKHAAPAILLQGLPGHRALAAKLGVRFVDLRPMVPNTLVGRFCADGRMGITYECSGQYDLDPLQVDRAAAVIYRMACALGIMHGPPAAGDEPVLFSDQTASHPILAAAPGLFMAEPLPLGSPVEKEQLLGRLLPERSPNPSLVRAPVDGYLKLLGVSRPHCDVDVGAHHPFVSRGDLLAIVVQKKQ